MITDQHLSILKFAILDITDCSPAEPESPVHQFFYP